MPRPTFLFWFLLTLIATAFPNHAARPAAAYLVTAPVSSR